MKNNNNTENSYSRILIDSVHTPENGLAAINSKPSPNQRADMTVWLDTRLSIDSGTPVGTLDNSFDSLIPLWRWFYSAARFQTIAPKMLEGMRSTLKLCGRSDELSPVTSLLFTQETKLITFAIGHYVGQCFTVNSPLITWGTHTDRSGVPNVLKVFPVLKGFVIPPDSEDCGKVFAPFNTVTHTAERLLCGKYKVSDLYDVCMKWAQYIPQKEAEL